MNFDIKEILNKKEVRDIITPLFNAKLNKSLSDPKHKQEAQKIVLQAINMLDLYITIKNGITNTDIRINDEEKELIVNGEKCLYRGLCDFENNKYVITLFSNTCVSTMDYLSSYLHEKRHVFQRQSVAEENEDVKESVRKQWKNSLYLSSKIVKWEQLEATKEFADKVKNKFGVYYAPEEIDAYSFELQSLIHLNSLLCQGKFTAVNKLTFADVRNFQKDIDVRVENLETIIADQLKNKRLTQEYMELAEKEIEHDRKCIIDRLNEKAHLSR